jgi:uncharacterized spore protein YtfJ
MNNSDTAVLEAIRDAIGSAGAGGVYGEPVSRDGVTVLPAAKLSGGGGGGTGEGNPPTASEGKRTNMSGRGNGGGFGVSAKPMGAFVIQDNAVRWRPAVDVNRVILGGQIVAASALLAVSAIVAARSRRSRRSWQRAQRM